MHTHDVTGVAISGADDVGSSVDEQVHLREGLAYAT